MTLVLSGLGCFPSYLHKFGNSDSPACAYCADEKNNADHTLFNCDAWHVARRNVEILVESDLDASNMVDLMLVSKNNWDAISKFITTILNKKKEDVRMLNI